MKKRTAIVLVSVALLVGAALPVAIAATSFPDVNPGNWFYDDVTKAAEAGIVTGYANGNYGPNDAVTRAQAAAFANRTGSSSAMAIASYNPVNSADGLVDIMSVTVDVPGTGDGTQYVALSGSVLFWINGALSDHFTSGSGDRGHATVSIYEGSTNVSGTSFIGIIESDNGGANIPFNTLVQADPGPHTYTVKVSVTYADSETYVPYVHWGSVVATTHAFGGAGSVGGAGVAGIDSGSDPLGP